MEDPMAERGETIPIKPPRPMTLAERVTARLRSAEQQKGEKASLVRSELARRRKAKAERAKHVQPVVDDEGSTLKEGGR